MTERTKDVVVVSSRYGSRMTEEFETLREALESIHSDIEFNEAAPVSLTMPATVIGAPQVTFTSLQLYMMCQLVDRTGEVAEVKLED